MRQHPKRNMLSANKGKISQSRARGSQEAQSKTRSRNQTSLPRTSKERKKNDTTWSELHHEAENKRSRNVTEPEAKRPPVHMSKKKILVTRKQENPRSRPEYSLQLAKLLHLAQKNRICRAEKSSTIPTGRGRNRTPTSVPVKELMLAPKLARPKSCLPSAYFCETKLARCPTSKTLSSISKCNSSKGALALSYGIVAVVFVVYIRRETQQ